MKDLAGNEVVPSIATDSAYAHGNGGSQRDSAALPFAEAVYCSPPDITSSHGPHSYTAKGGEERSCPGNRLLVGQGLSDKIASVTRDAQVYQAALDVAQQRTEDAYRANDKFGSRWWNDIALAIMQGRNSLIAEQHRLMDEAGAARLLKDVMEAE